MGEGTVLSRVEVLVVRTSGPTATYRGHLGVTTLIHCRKRPFREHVYFTPVKLLFVVACDVSGSLPEHDEMTCSGHSQLNQTRVTVTEVAT
jgi:hypothetical protein